MPVYFELFTFDHDLEYQVPSGSLLVPADSPDTLTSGATDWDDYLRDYSSQGPTNDGRTKPDLVSPSGVSTVSYNGSLGGTSASNAHTAGAVALIKQAYPGFSPLEIQDYLESRAIDLGQPGKDNLYGSGRLSLVSPPVVSGDSYEPDDTPNGAALDLQRLVAEAQHRARLGR